MKVDCWHDTPSLRRDGKAEAGGKSDSLSGHRLHYVIRRNRPIVLSITVRLLAFFSSMTEQFSKLLQNYLIRIPYDLYILRFHLPLLLVPTGGNRYGSDLGWDKPEELVTANVISPAETGD